tara:strand:- start:812 stop:991 length:180 start_codon:yes stop_codon:yes gene_type:complete
MNDGPQPARSMRIVASLDEVYVTKETRFTKLIRVNDTEMSVVKSRFIFGIGVKVEHVYN